MGRDSIPYIVRVDAPRVRHSAPPIFVLESGTHGELPDRYRSAALGFMAGALRWKKRDLAEWLGLAYHPLARKGTRPVRTIRESSQPVRIETVSALLVSARAAVLRELRRLSEMDAIDAGRELMHRELVTRCVDEMGVTGWAPVARDRMRLSDRVMSLFAADFLARPWDYEEKLIVCSSCDAVAFVKLHSCRKGSGRPAVRLSRASFRR